jgi:hypothetical protein
MRTLRPVNTRMTHQADTSDAGGATACNWLKNVTGAIFAKLIVEHVCSPPPGMSAVLRTHASRFNPITDIYQCPECQQCFANTDIGHRQFICNT